MFAENERQVEKIRTICGLFQDLPQTLLEPGREILSEQEIILSEL